MRAPTRAVGPTRLHGPYENLGEFFSANGNVIGALRAAEGDLRVLRPSIDGPYPRGNAVLFEEEWEEIDEAVIPAAQEQLVIVSDLQQAGLTQNLDDWSVLESKFDAESDVTEAKQSLTGVSEDEEDIPERARRSVPVPVTAKTFRLEARFLASSQRRGEGLDVTGPRAAGRSVSEKLEDMVFNGSHVTLSGNGIPGLTDFSARQTHTISTAWDAVTSNDDILQDVLDMIQLAKNVNYRGPFNLYVPGNWATVLDDDFKPESSQTVRQRLEAINSISAVRVADTLADSNVILVQMTPEVIDLAIGQAATTIQWEIKGGMVVFFKVFTAMVHRLKQDHAGNSGIVHGS